MLLRFLAPGVALLWMLAAVGCDDAATPGGDPDGAPPADMRPDPEVGPDPDAARPDGGPPPDSGPPPDMRPPPDAAPDAMPDAAPPTPGAPNVVAGGARRATDRFQMTVTVGGPAPTSAVESPRFRARIGVGIPSIDTAGAP